MGCTADGSMSRRGNCHNNAVDESFFQLLKRERIKWKIYPSREAAKMDVFNYIEMFYNPKRHHGSNDGLSSVEYERRYFNEAEKCLVNQWRFKPLLLTVNHGDIRSFNFCSKALVFTS